MPLHRSRPSRARSDGNFADRRPTPTFLLDRPLRTRVDHRPPSRSDSRQLRGLRKAPEAGVSVQDGLDGLKGLATGSGFASDGACCATGVPKRRPRRGRDPGPDRRVAGTRTTGGAGEAALGLAVTSAASRMRMGLRDEASAALRLISNGEAANGPPAARSPSGVRSFGTAARPGSGTTHSAYWRGSPTTMLALRPLLSSTCARPIPRAPSLGHLFAGALSGDDASAAGRLTGTGRLRRPFRSRIAWSR
jgi:hypothetical protein